MTRILVLLVLSLLPGVAWATATLPTLPTADVNVTMPTVDGTTYTAVTCADIQTHLNSAAAANVNLTHAIDIPSSLSCTQNFTLPSHTGGTGWILVRTSSHASLPAEGTRVTTAQSSLMPTLKYNLGSGDEGVFEALTGAQRYRFIGLDIQANSAITTNYSLVVTGYGNFSATNTGYIIIDRCLVRDTTSSHTTIRGVLLNADQGHTAVIDSYFDGIKQYDIARSADTQAILITANPGPILIRNNFLRAAGENIMTGGGGTPSSGVVPNNITIKYNEISKDTSWDRTYVLMKTLVEFKCSTKVLFEANDVHHMDWDDGGATFRLTVRAKSSPAGSGTNEEWCDSSDLTIRHNLFYNVTNFINSYGSDDGFAETGGYSMTSSRWLITNNLIYGLGWSCGGGASCGRFFQIQGGGVYPHCTDNATSNCKIRDLTISHNTVDDVVEAMLYQDESGYGGTRVDFKDNLINVNAGRGAYSAAVWGTNLLNAAYSSTWVWENNRLANIGGGENTANYPQGTNSYPASYTNFLWTNPVSRDYTLQVGSPAIAAASDGTDQGVNFTTYNAARAGGSGSSNSPRRFSPFDLRRADNGEMAMVTHD